jgi:segregation and condensation protein A
MDLLLYLIRRDEVDIYDIPIARITEQYITYVEALRTIDVDYASEFLVMAATLMEIKSKMLLPRPETAAGGDETEDLEDPRMALVRELIEYKKFRDAARTLERKADEHHRRHSRPKLRMVPGPDGGDDVELEEVGVWELVGAFGRLMRETLSNVPRTIVYDDTPVHEFITELCDRLKAGEEVGFKSLFEGYADRARIIGLFLAVLELARLKRLVAYQSRIGGDILLVWREDAPDELTEAELASAGVDTEGGPTLIGGNAAGRPADEAAEPTEAGPAEGSARQDQ